MRKNKQGPDITSYLHTDAMAAGYAGKIIIEDVELGVNKGEILTLIGQVNSA